MSGAALNVMDLVATLGVKMKTGDWANAKAALDGLKTVAEQLVKPFEYAVDAIRKTAETGDEIESLAGTFGVSTREFQEWSGAAELADVKAETFTSSLGFLSRQMAAAAEGSTEAVEAMGGISSTDAEGNLRPLMDVLGDVADHISSLPAGATRVAATLKLMGRGSRDMVGMMGMGRSALAALREQVVATGVVLSEEAIKASGAWDESAKKMRMSFEGLRNTFASPEVIGALTALQDALGEIARSKGAKATMEVLGRVMGGVLKALAELAKGVASFLEAHPETGINVLITALEGLALYVLPSVAMAFASVLPSMIGFAAGFAALYILADDISTFMEGGDSMIGRIRDMFMEPIKESDSGIIKALKGLKDVVLALSGDLPRDSWIYTLGPYLDHIFTVATAIADVVGRIAGGGGFMPPGSEPGVFPGTPKTASEEALDLALAVRSGEQRKAAASVAINSTVNVQLPTGVNTSEVGGHVAKAMDAWWDNKVRDEFVSMGSP